MRPCAAGRYQGEPFHHGDTGQHGILQLTAHCAPSQKIVPGLGAHKRSHPDLKHLTKLEMSSPDLSEVRVQRLTSAVSVSANPSEVRVHCSLSCAISYISTRPSGSRTSSPCRYATPPTGYLKTWTGCMWGWENRASLRQIQCSGAPIFSGCAKRAFKP